MSCFWSISVFISIKNNAVCGDLIIFQHFLGGTYSHAPKTLQVPMESCASGICRKHPPTHKKHLQTCLHNILNCRQQLPPPIWTNERVDKPLIKLKLLVPNFRGLWSNVWNIYWIWRVQRETTGSTTSTRQSSKLTSSSWWGKFSVQVVIILIHVIQIVESTYSFNTCTFFVLGSCRWSETNAWIKDLHSSSWRKQKLVNHLQVQTKHTICLLKHTSNSATDWRDLNIAASPSALLPFPSLSIIWCVQTQLVRIFGTHWSQHCLLSFLKRQFYSFKK